MISATTDHRRLLTRFGHLVVRQRRAVLALSVLFAVGAGAVGVGVAAHLSTGGFDDPASEAKQVEDTLERSSARATLTSS